MQGKFQQALEAIDNAIKMNIPEELVLEIKALSESQLNKFKDALISVNKAIKLKPEKYFFYSI